MSLPNSSTEFSSSEYWDQFFSRRGGKSFEWYAEFIHLYPLITKYVKLTDSILILGAGNSSLSADLYDSGHKQVTSVDVSEPLVDSMVQKYAGETNGRGDGFQYYAADCTKKMDFIENEFFGACIDKGTLDALASEDDHSKLTLATGMLMEVDRVLRPLGRYICISLLQQHILLKLIQFFTKESSSPWLVRIHRCVESEAATLADAIRDGRNGNPIVLPVFVIVATKLKSSLNASMKMPTVFETVLNEDIDAKPTRLHVPEHLMDIVSELQRFAILQQRIRSDNPTNADGRQLFIEVYSQDPKLGPRYLIYVVQRPKSVQKIKSVKYNQAVFIVPQGREVEWLFATEEGRLQLAGQVGCSRLLVIHLGRQHSFTGLQEVQNELSSRIGDMTPFHLIEELAEGRTPYLTSDASGGVGERKVRLEGESEMSGKYVVEDVTVSQPGDGKKSIYRRLIFLGTLNIIQSEAKLKLLKGKSVVDHSLLTDHHHRYIVANLLLCLIARKRVHNINFNASRPLEVLLIGLGGGCLASFIMNNLTSDAKLRLTCVDIDSHMKTISEDWFDLRVNKRDDDEEDKSLSIVISEGIEYLNTTCNSYDIVIFDVDSKSHAEGLACPPAEFVEKPTLERVRSLVSSRPAGSLFLNLVTRNEEIRTRVLSTARDCFSNGHSNRLREDLNQIIWLREKSDKENRRFPADVEKEEFGVALRSLLHERTHQMMRSTLEEMRKSYAPI